MRIVDVNAFFTPQGGGVKTYVEQKLRALPERGVEMVVVAPGRVDSDDEICPGGRVINLASPPFPLDRRYGYFNDEPALHALIARLEPDIIECSSPWSSASMVGRYPGPVPRALVMHADPLSVYAYRYLDPLMPRQWIDRSFDWYWQHLRRLDQVYGLVVSAREELTQRLRAGGLGHCITVPFGVEPGTFSPDHRDERLRAELLARCSLDPDATLLIGAGRHARDKRWSMVIEAVSAASIERPIGFVQVGGGRDFARMERLVGDNPHITLLGPVSDRPTLARLLASADAMVHGCETETFGFVPAEGRASGLPLIVPDQGGAADHLTGFEGRLYKATSAASLAVAIMRFIDDGVEEAGARARDAARHVMTMDDHFDALFARYRALIADDAGTIATAGANA